MGILNDVDLNAFLRAQPQWTLTGGALVREWVFADFAGAMEFVNLVASLAEETGHHPDIDIRYNKVRLSLISHDSGGITKRDTALAARLDG
jgi:4a-hydroxytetrahydrobiopterin dehydratase